MNRKVWSASLISSGGKKVGAAVLARSNCQRGKFKLQSGREESLKMAFGLLLTGHAPPVDPFRVTTSSSVRNFFVPNNAGVPSSSANCSRKNWAIASGLYL